MHKTGKVFCSLQHMPPEDTAWEPCLWQCPAADLVAGLQQMQAAGCELLGQRFT